MSSLSPIQPAPVVIIGAGRSGTNMLRDLLVSQDQYITWPCDEINYIWRHGNRGFETDQFTPEMADKKTADYIRKQFTQFGKQNPQATIVEKTCANSLRCGFVHQVVPNARFIHIIRDGRDVAASASLRWNAKLDIPYLMKKVKYVPWSDVPYYGYKYLSARVFKLVSGTSRLSTWGPKFEGMQQAFSENDLPVACAIQWKECVTAARNQLAKLDDQQVLTIRYEAFTAQPAQELGKVFDFLGTPVETSKLPELVKGVSNRSVGKWESQLDQKQTEAISQVAGSLLTELGYQA